MRLIALLLISGSVSANEPACLSRIMHAEAQGESISGVVAIGEAAIELSSAQHTTVCKLKGVHRAEPPAEMKGAYLALSKHLLAKKTGLVSKGADHWDKGATPHLPGKITRRIGGHVFYKLKVK
jgi:hypothetical protein